MFHRSFPLPVQCGGESVDDFLTNGSLRFYTGKDQWTYDEFVPHETTFAHYQWHHLVGTWSQKDGKRKFWVDGRRIFKKSWDFAFLLYRRCQ